MGAVSKRCGQTRRATRATSGCASPTRRPPPIASAPWTGVGLLASRSSRSLRRSLCGTRRWEDRGEGLGPRASCLLARVDRGEGLEILLRAWLVSHAKGVQLSHGAGSVLCSHHACCTPILNTADPLTWVVRAK